MMGAAWQPDMRKVYQEVDGGLELTKCTQTVCKTVFV
jgi:hypothetical protein